jgi:hypothetical protein
MDWSGFLYNAATKKVTVTQGENLTFRWSHTGKLISDGLNGTNYSASMALSIRAINDPITALRGDGSVALAPRFCDDWTGGPKDTNQSSALPKLVSGTFLAGTWTLNCQVTIPTTYIAEAIFYDNLARRWIGQDFLLEVVPDESFQNSLRPIVSMSTNSRPVLSASKLSSSFNFSVSSPQQIYFMEWSICGPGGQCTPYERRWYASNFGATMSCTLSGSSYLCGYSNNIATYPQVSLYIPGVGSPPGTWTLRLRALNFSGTYGVLSYTFTI